MFSSFSSVCVNPHFLQESQLREEERRRKKGEKEAQHKEEQQEAIKAGKRPYFLSKGAVLFALLTLPALPLFALSAGFASIQRRK